MAQKPVTDKKPIIWGYRYWSCRETDVDGASCHPCGGLFVYKYLIKTMNDSLSGFAILFLIGAILYVPILGIHYSTGSGQHSGYITAVEQTGIVFKTGRAYLKTDPQSSQEDSYCVTDPKVYEQLRHFSETKSRITVEYISWLLSGWKNCGGEGAMIVKVHDRDPNDIKNWTYEDFSDNPLPNSDEYDSSIWGKVPCPSDDPLGLKTKCTPEGSVYKGIKLPH